MFRSSYYQRHARKMSGFVAALLLCSLALAGAPARLVDRTFAQGAASDQEVTPNIPVIAPGSAYRQTNLTSDLPGFALIQDPLVVNPWGISMTASSPFWLANAGTSTSSLYRGDVGSLVFFKQPGMPSITIPGGLPTGTVANNVATEFVLPGACAAPPCGANFLFASITGNILGWDPNAPVAGSTVAVVAAHPPNVGPVPNVYTGLAIGNNGSGNFLYAANFSVGRIDVFNSSFALQPTASFPFVDPTLPAGYTPHNIQALNGELYVAYARPKPPPAIPPDVYLRPGGAVSVFDFNGVFKRRIHLSDPLNPPALDPLSAPWGLALAPASFGIFGGALLVGNFDFAGNARISAFNPATGAFLGQLQDESGTPISIDGLWGITFGNGGNGGDPNTLYFAAGIAQEEHGLFGSLRPTTASATSLLQFSTDSVSVSEGTGSVQLTVTRSGDVSGAAAVSYATYDQSQPNHANQKTDYEIAVGIVRFAPGETSKTFRVLLVDDRFDENDETVNVALLNPIGAGVGLGSPNTAELTIIDNDTGAPTSNPIDTPEFFVRQHYLDFLAREPESNVWVNVLTGCAPGNTACDRVAVSSSFFLSPEFHSRGYFAMRFYFAAYGRNPLYGEFMGDLSRLSGATPAETTALRAGFAAEFVTRNEFQATLGALTNAQYVDRLILNTGVTFPVATRDQLVADLNSAAKTRAQVLMEIVESPLFVNNVPVFNRAFVLAEYFGYLRRDPETAGFNAWLNFLNANPTAFRTMVNGFVNSLEYRQRFGAS